MKAMGGLQNMQDRRLMSINMMESRQLSIFRFNFPNQSVKRIITGNWGCGAFGGNLQLKFLIQWMAASLVGRDLVYCPFGSKSVLYN